MKNSGSCSGLAKFVYRLQGTLNLKAKLEEQKKMEYGQAITKLDTEKNHKIVLENEKYNNISAIRRNIENGISPQYIQSHNNYIRVLKNKISMQEKVILAAESNVEKKRLQLVDAMQERKKLEKLREQALIVYQEEEKIAEQKMVDEIVSYKYNNRLN